MMKRIAKLAICWIVFLISTIFMLASAIVLQREAER